MLQICPALKDVNPKLPGAAIQKLSNHRIVDHKRALVYHCGLRGTNHREPEYE